MAPMPRKSIIAESVATTEWYRQFNNIYCQTLKNKKAAQQNLLDCFLKTIKSNFISLGQNAIICLIRHYGFHFLFGQDGII
jgi:hypothetical protein